MWLRSARMPPMQRAAKRARSLTVCASGRSFLLLLKKQSEKRLLGNGAEYCTGAAERCKFAKFQCLCGLRVTGSLGTGNEIQTFDFAGTELWMGAAGRRAPYGSVAARSRHRLALDMSSTA